MPRAPRWRPAPALLLLFYASWPVLFTIVCSFVGIRATCSWVEKNSCKSEALGWLCGLANDARSFYLRPGPLWSTMDGPRDAAQGRGVGAGRAVSLRALSETDEAATRARSLHFLLPPSLSGSVADDAERLLRSVY